MPNERSASGTPLRHPLHNNKSAYRPFMTEKVFKPKRQPLRYDVRWDMMIEALESLEGKVEGWPNLPYRFKTPDERKLKLGHWLDNQRKAYHRGRLKAERIARLEALKGWEWSVFDAMFRALVDLFYDPKCKEWPNLHPEFVDELGRKLGIWVKGQQRLYAEGRLSIPRTKQFEQLPGWRWKTRKIKRAA